MNKKVKTNKKVGTYINAFHDTTLLSVKLN